MGTLWPVPDLPPDSSLWDPINGERPFVGGASPFFIWLITAWTRSSVQPPIRRPSRGDEWEVGAEEYRPSRAVLAWPS